jgi:hypothetical protein
MFRYLVLCIAAIGLSGCMETANPSFNGPSGAALNAAKCSQSSVGCLQKASQVCGGHYSVVDSESHSGDLLADVLPGPVTWYGMTYQCGPSDGKMPTFAFGGQPYVDSPTVVVNAPFGGAPWHFSANQMRVEADRRKWCRRPAGKPVAHGHSPGRQQSTRT